MLQHSHSDLCKLPGCMGLVLNRHLTDGLCIQHWTQKQEELKLLEPIKRTCSECGNDKIGRYCPRCGKACFIVKSSLKTRIIKITWYESHEVMREF